jgi:hypothetical protein
MVRVFDQFSDIDIPGIHVSYSRLFKNMTAFLWVSHADGCIFWALCYYQDSPNAWINLQELGARNGGKVDFFTQVLTSYLEAQKVMFFDFREARTNIEKSYGVFELVLGALINGSIFGNITNLIQSMDRNAALDKKAEKHNFRMDYLKKYMRNRKFNPELQKRGAKNEFLKPKVQVG